MHIASLGFMNMGGSELAMVVMVGLLTIYCIFDVFRSEFANANSKLLFLLLILALPILGSLAYLLMRRTYKTPSSNKNEKMPL